MGPLILQKDKEASLFFFPEMVCGLWYIRIKRKTKIYLHLCCIFSDIQTFTNQGEVAGTFKRSIANCYVSNVDGNYKQELTPLCKSVHAWADIVPVTIICYIQVVLNDIL